MHLLSTKVSAQPILEFASRLRGKATDPQKTQSRNEALFTFYHKDIEQWNGKIKNATQPPQGTIRKLPSLRERSPRNVLDVDIKGNAGTVLHTRKIHDSLKE